MDASIQPLVLASADEGSLHSSPHALTVHKVVILQSGSNVLVMFVASYSMPQNWRSRIGGKVPAVTCTTMYIH